jgi:hypothetical protein
MQVQSSPPQGTSPFRPPFQYSLWSMFVLTTAAAIGLAFFVSAPIWLMILVSVLLALALPMVLTIAVIYGRGRLRTFSIGALFPAGFLVVSIAPMMGLPFYAIYDLGSRNNDLVARLVVMAVVAVTGVLTGAFGLLALWVRRMVERPGWWASTGPVRPPEPQADLGPPPSPAERAD